MIRTLIVDDQSMIRVGIRAILDSQDDITVVGEAENGRVGVDRCRSLRPDVVLMDVRMPVLDGLAATRALLGPERVEGHSPRVLMLTTFDLDDYIYARWRPVPVASCSRTASPRNCNGPYGWWPAAMRCCRRASPAGSSSTSWRPGRAGPPAPRRSTGSPTGSGRCCV